MAASSGRQRLTITPTGTEPPVTLSALSLNPTSVVGGNGSTGTVTLSGAAPAGGAAVALSSNHAAATVPASVTVAAGATSATFAVNTSTVSANTTAAITGTLGGDPERQSDGHALRPCPRSRRSRSTRPAWSAATPRPAP